MKNRSIFNYFKQKSIKRKEEQAIKHAQEVSKVLVEGKQKAKRDFQLTLLKNLKEYNEAYEYFDKSEGDRGGEEAITEIIDLTKEEVENQLKGGRDEE
jgi:hypothetical protein